MLRAEPGRCRRVAATGFRLAVGAVILGAITLSTDTVSAAPPEPVAARSGSPQLSRMDAAERARLQRQVSAWNGLPLAQRRERRARYAAWRALTPSERLQLRAVAAQVATFAPDREQALRSQFDALDTIQQRAWRLGPLLGGVYQDLQPLLAYAPAGQGRAVLLMLRSMPADQHEDLARLVQRVPPQERQALREELLALAPERRGAWLKRRLAE